MSVGKICSRSVVVAAPEDTVREAARRMAGHNVGTVVVTDPEGEPLGILTDRDVAIRCVARDLDPDVTEVADVMTAPPRAVGEETPIEEAMAIMGAAGIQRLVVIGSEEKLLGILSLDDVLELLVEETEAIGRLVRGRTPDLG